LLARSRHPQSDLASTWSKARNVPDSKGGRRFGIERACETTALLLGSRRRFRPGRRGREKQDPQCHLATLSDRVQERLRWDLCRGQLNRTPSIAQVCPQVV